MRVKWLITLAFAMVFGAGAVVGMVPRHAGEPMHDRHSSLTEELHLTDTQREQMRAIWSEVMDRDHGDRGRQHGDKRKELQRQRDEEVRAMLSDEQKAKFDAVARKYEEKYAEMGRERSKVFQEAVEKTKKILDENQRAKYEAILKKKAEGGGGHGWGGGDSTSRPASEQQRS